MATNANTYGTVADLERMVGDIVEGRTFAEDTFPSLAQAEETLDAMAAELNGHLKIMDYTVPVAQARDPEAYEWIKEANSAGAAVRLLNMMPGEALDFDQEESSTNRKSSLWAQVRSIMMMIDEGRFPASRTTRRTRYVKAGATGEPLFRRGMLDLPGTRHIGGR